MRQAELLGNVGAVATVRRTCMTCRTFGSNSKQGVLRGITPRGAAGAAGAARVLPYPMNEPQPTCASVAPKGSVSSTGRWPIHPPAGGPTCKATASPTAVAPTGLWFPTRRRTRAHLGHHSGPTRRPWALPRHPWGHTWGRIRRPGDRSRPPSYQCPGGGETGRKSLHW